MLYSAADTSGRTGIYDHRRVSGGSDAQEYRAERKGAAAGKHEYPADRRRRQAGEENNDSGFCFGRNRGSAAVYKIYPGNGLGGRNLQRDLSFGFRFLQCGF